MGNNIKKILVVGAVGQIGSELTLALRDKWGGDNVVAMGRKSKPSDALLNSGPFEWGNITDKKSLEDAIDKHNIDTIINMAAILSATGEQNPTMCWDVNMNGLYNVLEIAREKELNQVLCPSSIAVFGPSTPQDNTPNDTILKPTTMYGVTKVAGELLCDYYVSRFNVDARGLRYPGIISAETLPGGGTTDYAVEIYYKALEEGKYTCFLKEDCELPMMYMPDCIKSTIDLLTAPFDTLTHHSDFNVGAFSVSPGKLFAEIKKRIPDFTITYEPDFRQAIADTWPNSVDDTCAREEWGWDPEYDLAKMTDDMLEKLGKRHAEGKLYG